MGRFRTLALAATLMVASAFFVSAQPRLLTMEEKQKMADSIDAYLAATPASSIKSVVVTDDKVTVRGVCAGKGEYLLAEITPWQDVTQMETFPYATAVSGRRFSITLDRKVIGREGINYDRVFSKWAVIKVDSGRQTLDSHARYADEVAPKAAPSPVPLRNKKGFGAGGSDLYFKEAKEIDVASMTMNVYFNKLLSDVPGEYEYGGIAYSIGPESDKIDRIVSKAGENGMVVSAILLCPNQSIFKDPENAGGFYSMPNITTAVAFNAYAAAIEYMASRYCSESPGRISHWIMHNEVDMGHEWTNMGQQPEMRFFDRYMKSMRICYNIVRQYDQNASVLPSYTHNWVYGDKGYSPKRLLEKTLLYSTAEGDFRWGIAYHPYPQDLTKPEFWKNDVRATFSLDTDFITFKNLEVLDKWIRDRKHFYKGHKRLLFLSEQGTNSPSYSDEDLALQAAGAAWAWKKASRLKGIDAVQWHNWTDMRGEFGLRIGLHTFKDGKYEDKTPKPAWYVWKAAGTDQEDAVFNQYLEILGIPSWDSIMHKVK